MFVDTAVYLVVKHSYFLFMKRTNNCITENMDIKQYLEMKESYFLTREGNKFTTLILFTPIFVCGAEHH